LNENVIVMQKLKRLYTPKLYVQHFVQMTKKAGKALAAMVRSTGMIIMLLVLSFVVPFSILYVLDPALFEATWIGRTFYLFFLWLVILEVILSWDDLQNSKLKKVKSRRTVLFLIVLTLPTLYVVWANYFGLNEIIRNLAQQNNMPWGDALLMRVPVEYLVFTLLFALMVPLAYGIKGLRTFLASTLFLGIIGTLYAIDTMYHGTFTPFQVLVPATTVLSASVLNMMGYQTKISVGHDPINGTYPVLIASNANAGPVSFGIAWSCSGIESLLIYAVVMALFLKPSAIRWIYKIPLFVTGAFITYFINILRVVNIFVIQLNGGNYQEFHDYYGPLLSVLWITSYPLIIIGIYAVSARFRSVKSELGQVNLTVAQN
jgi:exosortase/archaeosortase family protein